MKELEQDILGHFALLNCSFSDELSSFEELSTQNGVEFIIKCLWEIAPSTRTVFPSWILPKQVTGRFQLATVVADTIKACGVTSDFGYQTLLYGSPRDLRRIFLELIERLPKQHIETFAETVDLRICSICDISEHLKSYPMWVTKYCRRLRTQHAGCFWSPHTFHSEFSSPFVDCGLWETIDSSADSRRWIAVLQMANRLSMLATTYDQATLEFAIKEEDTHLPNQRLKPIVPPKPKQALEAEGHEKELMIKNIELQQTHTHLELQHTDLIQLNCKHIMLEEKLNNINRSLHCTDERWIDCLESGAEDIDKLLKCIEESNTRDLDMRNGFQALKQQKLSILEEICIERGITEKMDSTQNYRAQLYSKISSEHENIAAMNKLLNRLVAGRERISDETINRRIYTKRILEISNNIAKQQEEIDKLTQDILLVHKEIKWTSQAIERSFAIIEEALFKQTENSYKGEKAYKLFSNAHRCCQNTVDCIQRTSMIKRKQEELTDMVELEQQKPVDLQLERIVNDLFEIQEDNRRLESIRRELEQTN